MGQKSEHIKIHCTPEFKDRVQKVALEKGLTESAYARMKLKEDISKEVQA